MTTWQDVLDQHDSPVEESEQFRRTTQALEFGDMIRSCRSAAGLTQAELADLIGSSQPAVARLEAGRAIPKIDTLRDVANATGATLAISMAPSSTPLLVPAQQAAAARSEISDAELVRMYLGEINQFPRLSEDEDVQLAKSLEAAKDAIDNLSAGDVASAAQEESELRAAIGDWEDAERQLVQAHLRLVVFVAKRYEDSGVPLLDLIQEGNVGLLRAVEKFDWRSGGKFSTYASWWIRQAVTRAVADHSGTVGRERPHDMLAVMQAARGARQRGLDRSGTVAVPVEPAARPSA